MEKQELQATTSTTSPDALLQIAVSKDVDITKIEKLMQLKKEWDAQQAHKQFLEALSGFQSEVPALEKTKTVKFEGKTGGKTHYNYAPLGEIDEKIKSCMFKFGLSKRWEIADKDGSIVCTCVISHKDGHSEKTTMSAKKDATGGKNEIQQYASAITYMQRYTLIAALGLATADEDNDGTTAGGDNNNSHKIDQPTKWINEGTAEWSEFVVSKINAGTEPSLVLEQVKEKFKVNSKQQEQILNMKPAERANKPKILLTTAHKNQYLTLLEQGSKFEKGKVEESVRLYHNNVEAITKKGVGIDKIKEFYDLEPDVEEHYALLIKK